MEYTTIIIEVADTVTQGLAPLAIAGIASAIPGIARGIGSLFGGRKRRREERRAQRARSQRMAQFEAMEFTNPYQDIENSFEDLRVATEAAQMQQQTAQQVAAQGLATGQQAGLSPAALAQTQQNLINRTNQAIRADVARQEAANERLSAQGAMKADQLRGQGENIRQQLEMGKRSALLGMANQDLAAATRARAQAKANLVGGIGALGSAAFSAFGGGNQNNATAIDAPSALNASTSDILAGNFIKSSPTFDQVMNRQIPEIPQLNLIKYGNNSQFSSFIN
tara:strand:+ start:962 stop:1804 length:843 start_codon:yes stop_codon:yes gene_type:complete